MQALHRRGHQLRTVEVVREETGAYSLCYQTQRCPLTADTVATLLEPLNRIRAGSPPPPGGGFDGIDYTLTISSFAHSLTFAWWTDLVDDNWQPLVTVRERLYQLCRAHFDLAANEP